MKIGGLQKVTLIDFPGELSAIIFTKDCNFACPFCFNRDLVLGNSPTISQKTVLAFLKKRKKVLTGVVITGGEPLLQKDLGDFIEKVKKLGFKVKLDTNGGRPGSLKKLLEDKLLDYVALDIKAPLNEEYKKTIRVKNFNPDMIRGCMGMLLGSGIPFELRTTIVPGIHKKETLATIAGQLRKIIGKRKIKWFWQNFQPKNCLDPKFEKIKPYTLKKLAGWLVTIKRFYPEVELRTY